MKTKTAQDLFRSEREDWLDKARATARKLLMTYPTITIDDVTRICPRPQYVNQNTVGRVFKHPDFQSAGRHQKSVRPLSKGRWNMVWRLSYQSQLNDLPRRRQMFRQRAEGTVE